MTKDEVNALDLQVGKEYGWIDYDEAGREVDYDIVNIVEITTRGHYYSRTSPLHMISNPDDPVYVISWYTLNHALKYALDAQYLFDEDFRLIPLKNEQDRFAWILKHGDKIDVIRP